VKLTSGFCWRELRLTLTLEREALVKGLESQMKIAGMVPRDKVLVLSG
jgi:hypothetical protein